MTNFTLLEWDTFFFGYKIALMQLEPGSIAHLHQTIGKLKEENFKLAYCFVSPGDKSSNVALLNCSGILVDEKVTYSYLINQPVIYQIDKQVVAYNQDEVSAELVNLTLQSGIYSRFRIDPNFKNGEYENLYKEWILKSVNKNLADQVFVFIEDGHILGFVTLKIIEGNGSIGLLAVDENYRGKSIGKKLLNSSFAYFISNNITRIEVVTQKENQIACRFYESFGFKVSEVVNVYHLWIK